MHWSAEMALRLLKDQHACATGAASPQQGWCPWLASLPKRVITPLESDDTALEAVADPLVRGEVQAMQDCISACYEVRASMCVHLLCMRVVVVCVCVCDTAMLHVM